MLGTIIILSTVGILLIGGGVLIAVTNWMFGRVK